MKRRKRSPRPTRYRGRLKRTPEQIAAMKARWQDPEYRAKMMEKRRLAGIANRGFSGRFGVPDGMRKVEAMKLREQARESVTKTMSELEKAGVLDDADTQAREALETTLLIMRQPGDKKVQLSAARQVLEWTKAKPATKTDLTVNKAEAWLASITEDNDVDEGEASSTRKRLREDFEFWAKHCAKIRTKKAEIKPLILNRVQQRFLKHCLDQLATVGYIRSVDLKGRQQGISTVISAIGYWWLSQHSAQKGIIIAHKKDSTQTLFDMYSRLHKLMPELLRPSTKYSSRREIVFDALDTGLVVATAGGEDFGRGETLQFMHLSEVAFWPNTYAKENFNGLLRRRCRIAPGTMCFVE